MELKSKLDPAMNKENTVDHYWKGEASGAEDLISEFCVTESIFTFLLVSRTRPNPTAVFLKLRSPFSPTLKPAWMRKLWQAAHTEDLTGKPAFKGFTCLNGDIHPWTDNKKKTTHAGF